MSANPPVVLAPHNMPSPLSAGGGIPVTPGIGPTIATDRVAGQDYQEIKLMLGVAGVAIPLEFGQKPAALSIPVVLATGTAIDVNVPAGAATEATLLLVATEVTQLAVLTALADVNANILAGNDTLALISADGAAGNVILTAIEAAVEAHTALLTQIELNQDAQTALLTEIEVNTSAGGVAPPATSTVASVAYSTSNVTLLAANANRRGATIYNNTLVGMQIRLGANAAANFTAAVPAAGYYEVPYGYTGIIDGLWAAGGSGNAQVTELLP